LLQQGASFKEIGDLLGHRGLESVGIDVATVPKKRAQFVRGTVEPHTGVTFALDVEVNRLGELHASPPRSTAATARSAGRSTFAQIFPDFRPVTLSLISRYRERRSMLPFGAVTAVPPEETIFYAAKVTSNDPVLSRINPVAVRNRPSAMRGRNIQYFRRIAAIACSCSARSARKCASPLEPLAADT
jgi:hypothetical protein